MNKLKRRKINKFRMAEAGILFCIGLLFLAFSSSTVNLKILNSIYPTSKWEINALGLHDISLLYGLFFIFLSFSSIVYKRTGSSLIKKTRNLVYITFHNKYDFNLGLSTVEKVWVLGLLIVGIVTRLFFINEPMRYDESYTFFHFINNGFFDIFNYPLPNNHILYTILAKFSISLFGNSPIAIRLPALIFGITLIPITFYSFREIIGNGAGYFGSAWATAYPYFIYYSTNARGYILVVWITTLLLFLGFIFLRTRINVYLLWIAIISSLGLLVMPSMVFAVVSIFLWLNFAMYFTINKRVYTTILKLSLPLAIMIGAFTILLYTPTIVISNGIKSITANDFTKPQEWINFIIGLLPHFSQVAELFSENVHPFLITITLFFVGLGFVIVIKTRNWRYLLLFSSAIIGTSIVFLFQHRIPFARTWIYCFSYLMLLGDYGYYFLTNKKVYSYRWLTEMVLGITVISFSIWQISTHAISTYQTREFPEAKEIVSFLKPMLTSKDKVLVERPADWPINYYLYYLNAFENPGRQEKNGRIFIVVKPSRYSVSDLTKEKVRPVLVIGDDAILYEVVFIGD